MNIHPIYILLSILFILLVYIVYLKTTRLPIEIRQSLTTAEISGAIYNLEIANTPEKQRIGLMNRAELASGSGMLFVFEGMGLYPFWMKNTLIPLDIIWLNENKEVVFIKENAQPCQNIVEAVCNSIIPTKQAMYVIELNAGEVKKLGLKTGDKIDLEL